MTKAFIILTEITGECGICPNTRLNLLDLKKPALKYRSAIVIDDIAEIITQKRIYKYVDREETYEGTLIISQKPGCSTRKSIVEEKFEDVLFALEAHGFRFTGV